MIVRSLIWMTGVDPDEVYDYGEQRRYATFGALITFMFGWAAVAMGDAVAQCFDRPNFALVVGGALGWATLLCILDRLVTGMPLMKDGFGYRFFQVFLIRGMLALVGSLVTATAALLLLFHSAVDNQVHLQQGTAAQKAREHVEHSGAVLAARNNISVDNGKLTDLANAVTTAQRTVDTDRANAQCEAAGTCGTMTHDASPSKIGWATQIILDKEKTDQTALDTAVTDQAQQKPKLLQDIADNQAIIDGASKVIPQIQGADGLQERADALVTVLTRHWMTWPWALLVVAIELSVVLLKAFYPASRVDLAHRRQAADEADAETAYRTSPERQRLLTPAAGRRAELAEAIDVLSHRRAMARVAARQERAEARTARKADRRSRRRLRPVPAVAALVGSIVVAAGTWMAVGHHGANTATTPATAIQPDASFMNFRIPAPSADEAATTHGWLTTSGRALLTLHKATALTVAGYSPTNCRQAQLAVADQAAVLTAATSAPDDVIKELALDEVHDVGMLTGCPAIPSQAMLRNLSGVDTLFTQRLHQMGVTE